MTETPRTAAGAGRWFALGEASAFLGVDTTTLRRWADAGQVHTFRTPGGHRRFAIADLSAFIRRRHSATARVADVIGAGGAGLLPPGSGRRIRTQPWFRAVREPQAKAIGNSCRRLMAALAAYLPGGDPAARRRGVRAAQALGEQVAALGVSPAEATEAFVYFRGTIIKVVASRLPLRADQKIRSIRRIEEYFDRVHLILMDAYGRGWTGARTEHDDTGRMPMNSTPGGR